MKSAWTYELLTKSLYELLLAGEGVEVEHRRKYVGKRSGQEYEIDLSFAFKKAGVSFLVLVECKHYSKPVGVDDASEFAFKIQDIGAQKGILVTTRGFQKGVFRIANSSGIALVQVNEPDTFDVIISSRGPALDLDGASEEYFEHQTRNLPRPPLAVLESAASGVDGPVFFSSITCDTGAHVDSDSFHGFVNQVCCPDVVQEANSLLKLAGQEFNRKNYMRAEELCRQSLSITEGLFGAHHKSITPALNKLGRILIAEEKFDDARMSLERALRIHEREIGKDAFLAAIMVNLADSFTHIGNYTEAERLLIESLTISRAFPNSVALAVTLNNLARLYHTMGKYAESEAFYREAIPAFQKVFGRPGPQITKVVSNYAELLRTMGRSLEADRLLQSEESSKSPPPS